MQAPPYPGASGPRRHPAYIAPRPTRRRGCLGNLALALFLIFMLPVFLCGLLLVAYLVFPPPPLNVLIMGVDARPGEGYLTRTDAIMLAGIQPARLRVSLLSIPRDLFIDVPGYGSQRINTVNVLGENEAPGNGPALLSAAIENSFGIRPDRTIRLDFQGFIDLIDAVGGVTIDVERTIVDYAYPTADGGTMSIRFEPGTQHMDGETALIYARTRHSDDDYRRAERQQQVITALSLKLLNPLTWPRVVAVMTGAVDSNVSIIDMILYGPVVAVNAGRLERQVIDRELITANASGQAVPDYAKLAPWIEERFG